MLDANGNQIYQTPSIVPIPTATSVYSAPNITQAVTAPVQAPNLADPYALQDQFMNSPEIQAAKLAVSQGQGMINQSNQALRTTTTALENQNEQAMGGTGASINLIGRQVGRARTLTANELAGLGETQNANIAYLNTLQTDAQNKYQIAQTERAQLQDLIRQTSGKAGISFTDSYEGALQKADKYVTEVADQAKKDAYKDALKAEYKSLTGKTAKSMSTSELEKKVGSLNKSALESAKQRADQEWNMKVATFNKSMASGGSTATNSNTFYSTATSLKNAGKSWGEIANTMGQKYDLTPGSNYSAQLDAIMTGKAPAKSSGVAPEVQKLMDALGVSASTAEAMIKQEMGV